MGLEVMGACGVLAGMEILYKDIEIIEIVLQQFIKAISPHNHNIMPPLPLANPPFLR